MSRGVGVRETVGWWKVMVGVENAGQFVVGQGSGCFFRHNGVSVVLFPPGDDM